MKHTQEPWHAHGGSIYRDPYPGIDAPIAHMDRSDRARDAGIYPVERDENAKRAVACVNACAGIEDPAAELARLRRVEGAAREVLAECVLAHKYWGDGDNTKRASEAEAALRSALEG